MTRKEFFINYYIQTDRVFSDRFIWNKRGFSEEAWRKGQICFSKMERKLFIVFQYICLLSCWIPICFDHKLWIFIPFGISFYLILSLMTDFSFIKIETLYLIYNTKTVYCTVLHKVFRGDWSSFLDPLKRLTKRAILGFFMKSGGKFWGKYCAVCRNKNNSITINFKVRCVEVKINNEVVIIKKMFDSEEHLLLEIASVINNSSHVLE